MRGAEKGRGKEREMKKVKGRREKRGECENGKGEKN